MRELIAYLADQRVGRLIRKDNGNLQFRYDGAYAGPPISQAMPLQAEAHPHAACHAVFGGLLLEGEGRQALARALGVSPSNDYGLLAEVGGDCAGAITLLEPGVPLPTETSSRTLSDADLDVLLRELPQRPLGVNPSEGIRLSLAGAQPKLPVIIEDGRIALPTNAVTPTTHILKPEPGAFPGLVDNEAFCMQLAATAGLLVANVEKAATSSGLRYLIVERYDRDLTAEPIRRLHQEDLCQALGAPSDLKYQSEGGPGVRSCTELLRDATGVPAQELPRFWEALVLNWLIGNCDAHAKNFSLLYDHGAPTLAPLYDLVSTTAYGDQLTTRLAMSIGGATHVERVDLGAWLRLADETGFSERFARRTTTRVVERVKREAARLVGAPPHRNAPAQRIAERIAALAV